MQSVNYHAFFDGCCEPKNPGGNMGMGAFILDDNAEILAEYSYMIPCSPRNSNNVAEYMAFIWVVAYLSALLMEKKTPNVCITINGDSKMVICQMSGEWRIKAGMYVESAKQAQKHLNILRGLSQDIKLQWIPRDKNERADVLSKKHLIECGVEFKLQKQ